ncbi:MAG TPA: ShlB/FhaC/HecB family hemolysin secretion/activation protein [Caulobacteraceae bacterium]|jgi:hemolysin activation/secretion protein
MGAVNKVARPGAWLFGCWVLVALPATAQSVRAPSPEEILRLPPAMQVAAQPMGDAGCKGTLAPQPGEVASEKVGSFAVTGVTVFPAGRFDRLTRPIEGRTVSPEALNRVGAQIVCAYRERGYVFARAEVIRKGDDQWSVSVHEGVLGRLESAVDDPREARALRRAFRGLKPGRPINANDVRRGLLNAGVLGFTDIRPTVRQSRGDPDELDIVLVVQAPESIAQLHVDNSNSHTLGRDGALASLTTTGFSPLYARTSFGVFHSLDGQGQITWQASGHVLEPFTGTDVGLDLASSRALPRAELSPLDLVSNTQYGKLSLNRYLWVRHGLITHGSLALESVDQSTDLFGDFPFIRDRLRVVSLRGEAQQLAFGGLLNGSLEVRKGLSGLGASQPGSPMISVADADPQALVWRAEADYSHTFGRFGVAASVRGQYTDRSLLSFEQMTFGSLNGGPAFDPAAIAGDRGVAMTLQVQAPRFSPGHGLVIQPYGFTDAAHITPVIAFGPHPGGWATDVGGGLKFAAGRRFAFNLSYAETLGSGGAGRRDYGSRVLFSLDLNLDNPLRRTADLFTRRGSKP